MYRTASPDQLRRFYGFPDDYVVDGLLASGTWDRLTERDHRPHLVTALDGRAELTALPGMLGHSYDVVLDGRRLWFVPVMGTAMMAHYAHLASVFGSRKNILVGTAGGLSPDLQAGDFVHPELVRGTHSAWMYERRDDLDFAPDAALAAALTQRLARAGVRAATGPTVTCEALLAERWADITAWSAAGYLAVEMEAALVFALSRSFGIPAAAILYIADNLIAEIGFMDDAHHHSRAARQAARRTQYEVALAELLASSI